MIDLSTVPAHSFAPEGITDAERRACLRAAEASGLLQGLHLHRHGETCVVGCVVIAPDGTETPIVVPEPDLHAPVLAEGQAPAVIVEGAVLPAPDPTNWPAAGEVDGVIDMSVISPDPKSRNGHAYGRDAGL